MKKVGLILIGTSINPVVISLNNFFDKNIEKIYMLATEDVKNKKGTGELCDKIIEVYPNKNLEKVIIDRSNIEEIAKEVNKKLRPIVDSQPDVKLYFDYTGGTKIQAIFLKDYLQFKYKEVEIEEIYINGDARKIIEKSSNNELKKEIKVVSGANDIATIEKISKIKGYTFDDSDKSISNQFENIDINDYIMNFTIKLRNKLKGGNEGIAKVKLEVFESIYNAEKIGEEFCEVTFIVDKGRVKDYENHVKREFAGIKNLEYENRINFIEEE